MDLCLDLYLTYAKIGAMTFGGGYAMLPILKREVVDRKRWISEEELIDCYAIGQTTPGVIAVNTATLVGYRKKGLFGSVCATAGIVSPPLVIIVSIATLLRRFSENVWVKHALAGMSAAICAVIALTVAGLIRKTWTDVPRAVIGLCAAAAALIFNFPVVLAALGAAAAGIVITGLKRRKALKNAPPPTEGEQRPPRKPREKRLPRRKR